MWSIARTNGYLLGGARAKCVAPPIRILTRNSNSTCKVIRHLRYGEGGQHIILGGFGIGLRRGHWIFFLAGNDVDTHLSVSTGGEIGMFLEHQISAMEKGYWVVIFTVSINTNRLLINNAYSTSNNVCCTVTINRGSSNTSILICKQIVCLTTLADYWLPIMCKFKGNHMGICDESEE